MVEYPRLTVTLRIFHPWVKAQRRSDVINTMNIVIIRIIVNIISLINISQDIHRLPV